MANTKTYLAGAEGFDSFTAAVNHARATGSDVTLAADGRRVWTAPPPVSAKKLRYHAERVAAAEAYKRMKAGK